MLQKIKGIFQADDDAELQKEAGKLLATLSPTDKEALMRQLIQDMAGSQTTKAATPVAEAVKAAKNPAAGADQGQAKGVGTGAAPAEGDQKAEPIDMTNPAQLMGAFQKFMQTQQAAATGASAVGNAGAPAGAGIDTASAGSKDSIIAISKDPIAFRKDFYGENSVIKQYLKDLGGA